MSLKERDKYTGYMTTGHHWNGISELNTRVPIVLIFFLVATFLFSVAYWYLMPAWPTGDDYTHGKLGIDQKDIVTRELSKANALKGVWSDRFEELTFDDIVTDAELMQIVSDGGLALFRDNCAMCHGQQGEGNLYFPRLTDNSWLWGSEVQNIYNTLNVGINAGVEGTRVAMMPAFGDSGILNAEQITNIALYLRSLGNENIGDGSRVTELLSVNKGKTAYSTFCAGCHGTEATGNTALGAPNLTDSFWIYGGDQKSIETTLQNGRSGHMPAWQDRLTDLEIKILALYVSQLPKNGDDGED